MLKKNIKWIFSITLALLLAVGFFAFLQEKEIKKVEESKFVVVIPSYNNKEWYTRNLDSVFSQEFQDFRVIYVDDASPDGTGELVKAYIKEKKQEHRVTLIQNKERVGSLANLYHAIWLCKPQEKVIDLDGDDWLADERVISRLYNLYLNPDVWVTYGQFVYYPTGVPGWAAELPPSVIEQNAVREHVWITTALRTFYAGLFQKIKKEDLLLNGKFYPMAGDLAFMFPIVEMAGKHSRFIPEVLYVYNIGNAINDDVVNRNYQFFLGLEMRKKTRYQPIQNPY